MHRTTLVMAFVIFIGMGWLSSAVGPALPDLADRTGTDLAALGALFTAIFTGTMIAQTAGGPLNDRLGQRPVLIGGIGLATLGALGIILSRSLTPILGSGVVFGLGFGALDVSTNVLIARTFAGRSVPALNLLHVFYGLGSVIGPAVVGLALRVADTGVPALWTGAIVMLLPLPLVLRLAGGPATDPDPAAQASAAQDAARDAARNDVVPVSGFSYRTPLLWALGGVLVLYVGVEAGMGAWTATYVERSTALSADTAALVTSAFWLALTGGRVAGAAWGGRFTAYTVLWISLIGMLVGAGLLVIGTGSIALTVLAVFVIGFWAGPPFPTVVAVTTATFRDGPGKAAGLVVALGSVGAALLPWLQGNLLERVSSAASAWFILLLSAGMVGLYVGIRHYTARLARA